jgi:hypothetical protein
VARHSAGCVALECAAQHVEMKHSPLRRRPSLQRREAVRVADSILHNAAGNFYVNDKCTGAAVGEQVCALPVSLSAADCLWDWAHRCDICTGIGLTAAASVRGLGSPLSRQHRDCARLNLWHSLAAFRWFAQVGHQRQVRHDPQQFAMGLAGACSSCAVLSVHTAAALRCTAAATVTGRAGMQP